MSNITRQLYNQVCVRIGLLQVKVLVNIGRFMPLQQSDKKQFALNRYLTNKSHKDLFYLIWFHNLEFKNRYIWFLWPIWKKNSQFHFFSFCKTIGAYKEHFKDNWLSSIVTLQKWTRMVWSADWVKIKIKFFKWNMFNFLLQWRGDFTSAYYILGKYLDVEGFEGWGVEQEDLPGSEGEGCGGTRRGGGGEAGLVGRSQVGGEGSRDWLWKMFPELGSQDPTSGSCSLDTTGFPACPKEKRILKSFPTWRCMHWKALDLQMISNIIDRQ